jgi:hypothetical protein
MISFSAMAHDSCSGGTNAEVCDGPYNLIWKPYNAFDASSGHFHVVALTNIAEAFSVELGTYRVPTIKELVTIMGLGSTSFPTVDSWLLSAGYLISSTPGAERGGVREIMAIDVATRAVIALPMIGSGGEQYYLLSVK